MVAFTCYWNRSIINENKRVSYEGQPLAAVYKILNYFDEFYG